MLPPVTQLTDEEQMMKDTGQHVEQYWERRDALLSLSHALYSIAVCS